LHLLHRDTLYSQRRETTIVLVAIQSFFSNGKDHFSVRDNGRRRIGVEHV
jgi:hypothetical protein